MTPRESKHVVGQVIYFYKVVFLRLLIYVYLRIYSVDYTYLLHGAESFLRS